MLFAFALAVALQAPATDLKAEIQSQAADRLNDPESARWRWWAPKVAADGSVTMCGFYNAKNLMGGYVGYNPVWVSAHQVGSKAVLDDAEFAKGPILDGLAAKRCIAAGFDMTRIPAP